MSIVTIIGAGMMGSAMSRPAVDRGCEVRLVGTPLDTEIITSIQNTGRHPTLRADMPAEVRAYQFSAVDQALTGCELVICGVSSFGIDWFTAEVLPRLRDGLTVLSITKGMELGERGELVTFPEKWKALRPGLTFVAVGGPCICFELMARRHTLVHFVSADPGAAERTAAMLETDYYHLRPTNDVIGVECAVAMKNAYALGVAMTIGLVNRDLGKDAGLHYNSQAGAFYQATKEMLKLLDMFGASENCKVIGIGDLYVTVYGGRTRKIGILLGEGKTYEEAMEILAGVTLESLVVARRVAKAIYRRAELGKVDMNEFPLLTHANDVLDNGKDAHLPWEAFTFNDTKR